MVDDRFRQTQLAGGRLITDFVGVFHHAQGQDASPILQDNGVRRARLRRQKQQTDRHRSPYAHLFILGLVLPRCHLLPCSAMPKVTTLLVCGSGCHFPGCAACCSRQLSLPRTNLLEKPTNNSTLCAWTLPESMKSRALIASNSAAET